MGFASFLRREGYFSSPGSREERRGSISEDVKETASLCLREV